LGVFSPFLFFKEESNMVKGRTEWKEGCQCMNAIANTEIEDIKALLKNNKLRKEMGSNSRKYVENEHNLNKIINEYEILIKNLMVGD